MFGAADESTGGPCRKLSFGGMAAENLSAGERSVPNTCDALDSALQHRQCIYIKENVHAGMIAESLSRVLQTALLLCV